MAYYSKEAYEGKDRWAAEYHLKNEQIAISNGATKEQAEAISKLCNDRHYIHCYCERVFISESEPADRICGSDRDTAFFGRKIETECSGWT